RGQWLVRKFGKGLGNGNAQLFLDALARLGRGEGRNLVLQEGQLGGDVIGQQVAAGGEDLAELDEHRPQVLEGQTQAGAAAEVPGGRVQLPGADQQQAHVPGQRQGSQDLVQAGAGEDQQQAKRAQKGSPVHASGPVSGWDRRCTRASSRSSCRRSSCICAAATSASARPTSSRPSSV